MGEENNNQYKNSNDIDFKSVQGLNYAKLIYEDILLKSEALKKDFGQEAADAFNDEAFDNAIKKAQANGFSDGGGPKVSEIADLLREVVNAKEGDRPALQDYIEEVNKIAPDQRVDPRGATLLLQDPQDDVFVEILKDNDTLNFAHEYLNVDKVRTAPQSLDLDTVPLDERQADRAAKANEPVPFDETPANNRPANDGSFIGVNDNENYDKSTFVISNLSDKDALDAAAEKDVQSELIANAASFIDPKPGKANSVASEFDDRAFIGVNDNQNVRDAAVDVVEKQALQERKSFLDRITDTLRNAYEYVKKNLFDRGSANEIRNANNADDRTVATVLTRDEPSVADSTRAQRDEESIVSTSAIEPNSNRLRTDALSREVSNDNIPDLDRTFVGSPQSVIDESSHASSSLIKVYTEDEAPEVSLANQKLDTPEASYNYPEERAVNNSVPVNEVVYAAQGSQNEASFDNVSVVSDASRYAGPIDADGAYVGGEPVNQRSDNVKIGIEPEGILLPRDRDSLARSI